MIRHPYKTLPAHCFWKQSIEEPDEVDPVVRAKFRIGRDDKVATAGSCFAQHIARHLKSSGFTYFVTEEAHPLLAANPKRPEEIGRTYNYGTFSARYGNLYTSRQLLQLLQRAFGTFQPREDVWVSADRRFIDPFRPEIQPGGFATREEFDADRRQHLAAVRRMLAEMNVFVFTLGLTEAWSSCEDGAVFPLCPGVSGGEFNPLRYRFINLTANEVMADMQEAIDIIKTVNRAAKILLTVSPIPLIATAIDRSVLVSTTYSKSALRVAAEEIANANPDVAYFPSYEIITGPQARGRYFARDLRSVTEDGVAQVMRLFMRHYAGAEVPPAPMQKAAVTDVVAQMQKAADVVCEEESLARA